MPDNYFANKDTTYSAYWEVTEAQDEPSAGFEIKGKVNNGMILQILQLANHILIIEYA